MSTSLLNPLLESGLAVARTMGQVSWQVALWALVVWVLTRAWPTLPASVRTTLWWLVGLKCLVGMFALGSLNLPLLPAPEAPAAPVERVTPGAALAATARPPAPDAPRVSSRQEATPEGSTWTLVLLLPWLGGLAWQTRTLLQELRHLRHLRRESRPLEDASLLQVARELGQEMGLARRPQVRVSEQATSPFAFNPWRPEVILPRRALETLSPQELRMALAHEFAHVRRRDLWLGWVPALAQALLFFHPLVRRASREYALAREEACDAAAIQATGAAPREYGRLLLLFGVARAPAAAAASVAPTHLAALKRRITMLDHAETQPLSHWIRRLLGALALVALVPIQVVARETPATPPPVPLPAALAEKGTTSVTVQNITTDEDTALSYVLINPPHHTTMSGTMNDLKAAQSLMGQDKQPLLYVRRDGREYVIRDEALQKVVAKSFEKQRALGEQQSALGQKMSEVGQKMSEAGQRQSELGMKQSTLAAKLARLAAREADIAQENHRRHMNDEEIPSDVARQEEEIQREMQSLEDQMEEELRRQMQPSEEQMHALGEQMRNYEKPMEELGRQMEAATREAHTKVRDLLDDAIRKGLAEPVKR